MSQSMPKPTIEDLISKEKAHKCPPGGKKHCVKLVAIADLPSRFGHFQVASFYNDIDDKDHAAFIKGDVCGKKDVPMRLHSECLTGDAIGSLRCDCRDQLEESLNQVGKREHGIVLYLSQEGRGIGFLNKIKAYQLQDAGHDTVEANKLLGFQDDERDYDIAAHMLQSLGVESVKIMTNNPKKIADLKRNGIQVTGRLPLEIPPNPHNLKYLQTKKAKSGHLLEQIDDVHQPENTQ